MKITQEVALKDFEFWAGAKHTRALITNEEMDLLEGMIEDIFPDGIDETKLNDLFWFDTDFIAEILGYESDEEMWEDRK